jgi:hypothetical protein
MMKKYRILPGKLFPTILPVFFSILCSFWLPVFLRGHSQDPPEYSLNDALKVQGLIEMLQQAQLEEGGNPELRNVVVTESELNSYIAYLIEVDQEEILKELRVKMFENNRVEWKIVVDLEGANLPKILKPRMTFYMGGKLEVENNSVRLNLEDLFLENQRIQVQVFELVIFLGSRLAGSESFSMNDWWALPYGIKDIKTQLGKATFYY